MRLARFQAEDGPRLGAVVDNMLVDLNGAGWPGRDMLELIGMDDKALARLAALAAKHPPLGPVADANLLAPLPRPGKYLAIGMNYRKHVEEAERLGVGEPARQFWFNKQTSCIAGPFDAIDPGVSEEVDHEVELAIIIGRSAKHVSPERALDHVFGYCVANDVSARDWQFHSPTFTMGKSFDTHGPIGPWIVTADEIADPQSLDLRCLVNGELRQSSNTSQMIHRIADQIAYLSTAFTLEPGDLIATGTPEGVGVARDPQLFLQRGDVVRCEIDGIGAIENRVGDAS